jgi:hypothetical protein
MHSRFGHVTVLAKQDSSRVSTDTPTIHYVESSLVTLRARRSNWSCQDCRLVAKSASSSSSTTAMVQSDLAEATVPVHHDGAVQELTVARSLPACTATCQ